MPTVMRAVARTVVVAAREEKVAARKAGQGEWAAMAEVAAASERVQEEMGEGVAEME